ncbi:hypothetical protein RFI_11019, partial [Reticulomyxa filosa]
MLRGIILHKGNMPALRHKSPAKIQHELFGCDLMQQFQHMIGQPNIDKTEVSVLLDNNQFQAMLAHQKASASTSKLLLDKEASGNGDVTAVTAATNESEGYWIDPNYHDMIDNGSTPDEKEAELGSALLSYCLQCYQRSSTITTTSISTDLMYEFVSF